LSKILVNKPENRINPALPIIITDKNPR